MTDRKTALMNNANTRDYTEAYMNTRSYDFLLKLYNIDFETYINSMSGAISYFATQGTKPFVASPEQARAIYSTAKRIGIVASAGSGKTTTMLRKLQLNRTMFNWKESEILAITYTSDAAKNMRDNYIAMVAYQPNSPLIDFKTIHKYGKEFIETANPSIQLISEDSPMVTKYFDESTEEFIEQETTIHQFINMSMQINGVDKFLVSTRDIINALSVVSEKMIDSEEKFRSSEQFINFPIDFAKLMEIKDSYTKEKASKSCMDYVDMLETIHLIVSSIDSTSMIEDPRLRRHIEFKAIYLDEAQDVSPLQISIINHLLRLNPECQLVVVGDDDQSIFGFRGANPDYLVNLQDEYPLEDDGTEPLEIIYMTQNRRSAPLIVNSTNKLISHNTMRYDKEAKAFNEDLEGNIEIIQDMDGSISTHMIVEHAKELYRNFQSARDMAVLYREHSQVRRVLNEIIRERIPFNMPNKPSDRFLIHRHFLVKDMIGIMQMLADLSSPYHIENFLYKLCPYLGVDASKTIASEMRIDSSKPLHERRKLSRIIKEIGRGQVNNIILECYRVVDLSEEQEDNYELINTVYKYYKSSYLDWYLSKNQEETGECEEALNYLLEKKAIGYQGLRSEILDDTQWTNTHYNYTLGVKFRTFHTSKGLEWKDVFLLPISNRVSPKVNILQRFSPKDRQDYLEEERRLFYVACTRAISNLKIFYEQDSPDDTNIYIEEMKKAVLETEVELGALKLRKENDSQIQEKGVEETPVTVPCNTETDSSIIPMPVYN